MSIENIPLDDTDTYKLLGEGRTYGIFQLESPLGRHWSKQLLPTSISDLGALIAILRPGALKALSTDFQGKDINNDRDLVEMAVCKDIVKRNGNNYIFDRKTFDDENSLLEDSGRREKITKKVTTAYTKSMTQRFCDRKNNREETTYIDKSLEPILKDTYGQLIYQEGALQIARDIAGFTLEDGELLRKSIGKKLPKLMAELKDKFIEGCLRVNKVNKEIAEEIFGWIQESQKYSFNQSHSISYSITTYHTAYCKTHYPLQFYCAYLQGSAGKIDKHEEVKALYADAKQSGIEVKLPDLRHKQVLAYIKNDKVYFGLSDIKFVGVSALNSILQSITEIENKLEQEVCNWSWTNYLIHFSDNIASDTNKALISAGALDYLGVQRQQMLYEYDTWNLLTKKEKQYIKEGRQYTDLSNALLFCSPTKKNGGGCNGQSRSSKLTGFIQQLAHPEHSLQDTPDKLAWLEEKYLGVSLSFRRSDVGAPESNFSCAEFNDGGGKEYVVMAVEVENVKKIKTKNGDNPGEDMAIYTVSDKSGQLEGCVCFPDAWREFGAIIYVGNSLKMQGNRGRKGGFILEKCWEI